MSAPRDVSWAVVVQGDVVGVDRLIRSHIHALDLPPGPLVGALEACPKGATLLVDVLLVEGRPITAGLVRAFAEQRGFRPVMTAPQDALIIYAACRAVFATAAKPDARTLIQALRAEGHTLARIAHRLEHLGIPAPGGGRWHRSTILRLQEGPHE